MRKHRNKVRSMELTPGPEYSRDDPALKEFWEEIDSEKYMDREQDEPNIDSDITDKQEVARFLDYLKGVK